MKINLLITITILVLISCGKNEKIGLNEPSIHTEEHFIQFSEHLLCPLESEMLEDGSVIIVGNGGGIDEVEWSPFLLKISETKEIENLDFLKYDNRSISRRIKLLLDKEENFIILSNAFRGGDSLSEVDLRKIDRNFQIEWHRIFGEINLNERGESIALLPNGDYMTITHVVPSVTDSIKFILSRISSSGELIWNVNLYYESIYFAVSKLLYLPTDNSLLVITEHDFRLGEIGDIKITKIDLEGNILGSETILKDTDFFHLTTGIKILEDGNIIAYYSSRSDSSKPMKITIMKLTPELSMIWKRVYNDIESDRIADVFEAENNELLILSNSSSLISDNPNIIVSRADKAGKILFNKVFGSPYADFGNRIFERLDSNILIIGSTTREGGSDRRCTLFLLETDSKGNPI